MEIAALYSIFLQCSGVTIDSRNCPPNALFIAIKGDRFNGNQFAIQSLEKGCAYAIVEEPIAVQSYGERILQVDSTLQTLQALARYHRQQMGLPIIGITGTNGKTTTKELIAAVLSEKYPILYTQGNLNNAIGVPLTLLQLQPSHKLAIIEMGASHQGDIKELVEIACPNYGIITNIGRAHLEGFGSLENILSTKGELFDYLRATAKGATIFVDQDNPYLSKLTHDLTPIYYGTTHKSAITGKIVSYSPFLQLEWCESLVAASHTIQTQLIGAYNLQNVLAAITIGRFFHVESKAITKALTNYKPQNNRSQLAITANNHLIIDTYNANPTSMMAALENFLLLEAPTKMLLLGDMKELGTESAVEHQKIVDYLRTFPADKIVLIGQEFAHTQHPFLSFPTREELADYLTAHPVKGYHILLKGSNSMKLEQLIPLL
ncbi:MAG: UDP-N-acetylmuramoyl-tripeptide--D-alanyl-D-alanine ligase [Bacteroidaceae bacterium]|nr:UDP-N-acetylmuramoyl-tripeptide--D-alanyl-D-alanine ligase [Bacteroidaceae bacterium]